MLPNELTNNTIADADEVMENFNYFEGMISGDGGVSEHTVIKAGTNKLVKLQVLRQDDIIDSYKNNSVILTGWGYLAGAGAVVATEAVTFGITFSEVPIVVASYCGAKTVASGAPANPGDSLGAGANQRTCQTSSLSTTGFDATMSDENNLVATVYYAYTWIAIGQLN